MFLPFAVDFGSSVGRKAVTTLEMWKELGASAQGFALSTSASTRQGWTIVRAGHGEVERQRGARRLAVIVRRSAPDIVYTRFSLWAPGVRPLLGGVPLVEEVNTDDRIEVPLWSRGAGIYHRLTRRMALARRDGWVFVTDELRRRWLQTDGTSTAVLSNGIDLRRVPSLPAPHNPRPRGLFLAGTGSVWHGADKLVRLATRVPSIDIDLVGHPNVNDRPPNLHVHPYVSGEALLRLERQADFAIGTLALHRKGMEEACPLKVREYLALGLPTIIGYHDADVRHLSVQDVLRIPNIEHNVEVAANDIEAFAHACSGRRVDRQSIRSLDSRGKEDARLRFLSEIANRS